MRTPDQYAAIADEVLTRLLALADDPEASAATRARALADAAQLALILGKHQDPMAILSRTYNASKENMGETNDDEDTNPGTSPRKSGRRTPRPDRS